MYPSFSHASVELVLGDSFRKSFYYKMNENDAFPSHFLEQYVFLVPVHLRKVLLHDILFRSCHA